MDDCNNHVETISVLEEQASSVEAMCYVDRFCTQYVLCFVNIEPNLDGLDVNCVLNCKISNVGALGTFTE